MTYTPQTPLVEQRHTAGFLVSEGPGHQSIDRVQIAAGSGRLQPGTVLAFTSLTYAGTGAAGGTNVGNGTLGSIAITAPALVGTYTITLVSATEFNVTNPNGELVAALGGTIDFNDTTVNNGPGQVGTPFNSGGIGFLITAGATAFQAGDSFTIAVTITGNGWTPLTAAVAAGTPAPSRYGLLYGIADTTYGASYAAAVTRLAEVNLSELVWDPSLSPAQQDAALAALNGQGVIAR